MKAAVILPQGAERQTHQAAVQKDHRQRPDLPPGDLPGPVGIANVQRAFVPRSLAHQGQMGGGRRAAFIAVDLMGGVDGLALHPFGQGGGDLGQGRIRRLCQCCIARQSHLGQPQHQRLNLQPCEHLWRQGRVFGQAIAHPCRPVDQGTASAQCLNIAIQGARADFGFFRKPSGGYGRGQAAQSVKQAKQAIWAGHQSS